MPIIRDDSDEIIRLSADFDINKAKKAVERLQKVTDKRLKMIEKEADKLGKGMGKVWKSVGGGAKKHLGEAEEAAHEWFDALEQGADDASSAIEALEARVKETSATIKKAGKDAKEEDEKALQRDTEELKNLRDQQNEYKRLAADVKKAGLTAITGQDVKIGMDTDGIRSLKEAGDNLREAGADFVSPLTSVLRKDLPGAFENIHKPITVITKVMAGVANRLGDAAKRLGKAMQEKGAAKGGKMGGLMQMGGKAASAAGGMKGLEGLASMLSKIGPLLAGISALVVGLVKLFLDADAMVKEFNKGLLESASTSEYLARSGGNAEDAFKHLESSMKAIRDSALSLDNLKWGISKEEHMATLNALNQEGVSIKRIEDDAKSAGKEMGAFSAEIVHTAVTYKRQFGVSLQEISQFQGELMSELGMNLAQVQDSFAQMTLQAANSGMAANKFFGILRGMSADLSLFNLRLADAGKLLTLIGKAMNPRNAQKFMQTLSGFYKGKGLLDRLKHTIIGGAGSQKNLKDDVSRKIGNLVDDFKKQGVDVDPKALQKAVEAGPKESARFLAQYQGQLSKEGMGELKDAMFKTSRMSIQANSKSQVDQASAMREMDLLGSYKQAALVGAKLTGQSIDDLSGVNILAAEQAGALSEDEQKQFQAFGDSMRSMKEDLAWRLEHNKTTAEDQVALAKMGIKDGDNQAKAEKVRAATIDDLWKMASDDQKKLLDTTSAAEKLAQETGKATQGINDKIGILADWFMGQFYNVVMGMWDAIAALADKFSLGGKYKAALHTQQAVDSMDRKITGAKPGGAADAAAAAGGDVAAKLERYFATQRISEQADKMRKDPKFQESDVQAYIKQATSEIGKEISPLTADAMSKQKLSVDALQKMGLSMDEVISLVNKIGATPTGMTDALATALKNAGIQSGGVVQPIPLPGGAPGAATPAPPPTPAEQAKAVEVGVSKGTPEEIIQLALMGGKKGSIYTHDDGAQILLDGVLTNTDVIVGDTTVLHDIYDALRKRGIVLDKNFLQGVYGDQMEKSVLDATRKALFEFWLYKDMSQDEVMKAMQEGNMTSPGAFAESQSKAFLDKVGGKNAVGGAVLGVGPDGMATITRAPAGEAPAFVGRGETITPAGGGGGGGGTQRVQVSVALTGDFAKYLQATVQDGIYEDKRRSKFT